jgi:hypothetical protein
MRALVTIDFRDRGLEDAAAQPLGQAQHVDRAMHRRLGRLNRTVPVMHGRGKASQIVDLVRLEIQREGHIVADELEAGMGMHMVDVALGSGEQVVNAQHLVA